MIGRQTALERLHKSSISAKDIANQFWCEKQMELYYTNGQKTTAQMDRGTQLHETLQVEVFVPLTIEPASYADRVYKTAYENVAAVNTLMEKSLARELRVYGSVNGYRLSGQIDELQLREGKVCIIENKTTDARRTLTSAYVLPHTVQVMLYKKTLDEMRSGAYTYDNYAVSNRIKEMKMSEQFMNGLRGMNLKDEYMSLEGMLKRMFETMRGLPEISDSLEIHYIDRNTGKVGNELRVMYDKQLLGMQLVDALKYWNGEREARPVPEEDAWKCRICRFFGKECTVWYNKGSNASAR
ncbi:MAG: PD-(D/E)XK nuclease family protein [Candidatus Micrarchaeota archaeon]|nr:PD-(D/E)XK nuclease family protein [Candidatus Micrarchaeota archaeon]MDE1824215.1 PD-(D/E)XK nuclease family protein [Candidatus Micrarchaeota archaeon]MDE1849658.1 PD-(D/E)XK nuclease family protein [Candidatus Micrarchaeota archaeon]